MSTPMEKVSPEPKDELFEVLFADCISELSQILNMGPIHVMSLIARYVGMRSACIDRLMQENHEFRVRICLPGKDHLVGETDCDDLFKANYQLAYDEHVAKHKKKTAHAEGAANELLNSVCESHKKGDK